MNLGKLFGAGLKALVKIAKPIVVAAAVDAVTKAAAKKLGKKG